VYQILAALGFRESIDTFEVVDPNMEAFEITSALIQDMINDLNNETKIDKQGWYSLPSYYYFRFVILKCCSDVRKVVPKSNPRHQSEKQRVESLNELQRAREERARDYSVTDRSAVGLVDIN
jgi:hypothetical protein